MVREHVDDHFLRRGRTMTPEQTQLTSLLREKRYLLLDFDGPICAVFGELTNREVSRILSDSMLTRGLTVPFTVSESQDPFDVLRYAGQVGDADSVERELRQLEVEAVLTAPQTEHALAVLRSARHRGTSTAIVSNNSSQAVRAYLDKHDAIDFVCQIASREQADPSLLKPNPHLLQVATRKFGCKPHECLFVGDSVSDIQAAQAAGIAVVAYVNKPGKRDRLADAGPDVLVTSMADLHHALIGHPERDTPSDNTNEGSEMRNTP